MFNKPIGDRIMDDIKVEIEYTQDKKRTTILKVYNVTVNGTTYTMAVEDTPLYTLSDEQIALKISHDIMMELKDKLLKQIKQADALTQIKKDF